MRARECGIAVDAALEAARAAIGATTPDDEVPGWLWDTWRAGRDAALVAVAEVHQPGVVAAALMRAHPPARNPRPVT